MAVSLEIRDGNPWWLSPDIWVVPGNNPTGQPGRPVAGQPEYLWARVRNNGDSPGLNAAVRFYAANPAVGFDRSTADLVGSAYVSLQAGAQSDVLCLVPWLPKFINGGHVCVLAEAFHATDPLPPGNVFNQPTDRHVAQLNLNVAEAPEEGGIVHGLVEIHNPGSRQRQFTIAIRAGEPAELDRELLERLTISQEDLDRGGAVERAGLLAPTVFCPALTDLDESRDEVAVDLEAGAVNAVRFAAEFEGSVALVHVLQYEGDAVVGGSSYILVRRG